MKKMISAILAVALIVSTLMFSSATSAAENNTIKFECGTDAAGHLDLDTGVLTIKGNGEMNFFYADHSPWWSYRDRITEIVVEEGITRIASCAFLDCNAVKLTLPASLEVIEQDALSMTEIKEIIIPENSRLCSFPLSSYFQNDAWYKSQPDGLVYMGNLLLCYKGTMPANTTITVKDGTYAINTRAFYNKTNLIGINVPQSVERIGYKAFYGTTWFNEQPYYEPVYVGKVLYFYNFPWRAIQQEDLKDELVIKEGIVSVSDYAFSSHCNFRNVVLPASLEHIGEEAFSSCYYLQKITVPENSKLKHIDRIAFYDSNSLKGFRFPEGFERLGTGAFLECDMITEAELPASFKSIGLTVFTPNSLNSFKVSKDNPYFSTDENGILYSKDKTVAFASPQRITSDELTLPKTLKTIEAQAFVDLTVKKITIPDSVNKICFEAFSDCEELEVINIPYGVERICDYTFSKCNSLGEIEIPKTVRYIGIGAFSSCSTLEKAVIPEETVFIAEDAFDIGNTLTIYCYENSTAYYYATENRFHYELLEHPDTSELDKLIEDYENLDRNKYFPESLIPLDRAVADVDFTITVITQEMVDGWVSEIKKAEAGLRYVPADYSGVEAAKILASGVDRSLYTAESLAVLDEAIAAVDTEIDISNQATVDAYAKAIIDAVRNLKYLPADYSEVNAAVAKSEKLNRKLWSQATLTALDQSIGAVDYTLNITQQAVVDGFAKRINDAIAALEYAEVVLRNNQHGVIVSATTKEINPDSALSVDIKDASDLQSGNFAVGGTVKSITLYDINLLLNATKVQPSGFVTVKIKLPDGVDPNRCKVYHVVDDPIDNLVRFSTTLEGNYIVFETDHFSEFAVIEVETTLESIEITKLPEKTEFALGEAVVISGMEVTATYSDGSTQAVTDYDVSSVDNSYVGTKTVTVYFTHNGVTKSKSFEITISGEKVSLNITQNGAETEEYTKQLKWYKPYCYESVQLGYTTSIPGNYRIEWSSDNSKVTVDENGNVSNKSFFFARKAVITAKIVDTQGNVIAQDSVTVRFYKFSFQLSRLMKQALSYFMYS